MIIKRKLFAGIHAIGDELVSGASAGPRSQSYYDSLAKEFGSETNENLIKKNKGIKVGSDVGTRNLGGTTVYNKTAPKLNLQQVAQSSYNRGQSSVGIKRGALNTWNRMGRMGKAGTVAAGIGGVYLMGKGLFGGKK